MKVSLALAVVLAALTFNGTVKLTTQWRGPELCFDLVNGGPRNLYAHLAPCTKATGQYWKIDPI